MDTVILAAGKGTRLDGIAPPFHKPLMVVNGKPIIVQCVEAGLALTDRVTVVVAPENALPISQVLGARDVTMIVQRYANGPGAALLEGFKACTSTDVLVLMGDNVTPIEDVSNIVGGGNALTVGTRQIADGFERFTRRRKDGRWVENEPVTREDYDDEGYAVCWLGPFAVNRKAMTHSLSTATFVGELPIGPLFNDFLDDTATIPTRTIDIGVPEALA